MLIDNQELIRNVFFNYENHRLNIAKFNNIKFSHYTSAEAAISIIKNKKIWMRNIKVMNDYSEVKYGQFLLTEIWHHSDIGNEIKKTIKIYSFRN